MRLASQASLAGYNPKILVYTKEMIFFLSIFIGGGLFGWTIDTAYRTWRAKHYTSGTLVPFFSVIYGIAAVLLYTLFNFFQTSFYLHIILGAITCTLLELIFGFLSLTFLKRRFWNYSASRFNYRGLIDAEHSFYWLILSGLYRIFYQFLL